MTSTNKDPATINSLRAFRENSPSGSCTKGNLYSVPLDAIEEKDGFNPRDYERPDVEAHIESLAQAYMAGVYVPPPLVQVVEGRIFLVDGYCRTRGARRAVSRGAQIERLEVMEHKGDEASSSLIILTSNQGLTLSPIERAEIYQRLSNWGKTPEEIATSVGKSVTHVNQWLQLLELPLALKNAVRDEQVSASAALKLYQEKGPSAAVEALDAALTKANGAGKTRVTTKALATGPRLTKSISTSMFGHMSSISDRLTQAMAGRTFEKDDVIQVDLTAEEAQAIIALREKAEARPVTEPATDPAGAV